MVARERRDRSVGPPGRMDADEVEDGGGADRFGARADGGQRHERRPPPPFTALEKAECAADVVNNLGRTLRGSYGADLRAF